MPRAKHGGDAHQDAASYLADEEARTGAGWGVGMGAEAPRQLFDLGVPTEFKAKALGMVSGPQRDTQELIDHIDSAKRLGNIAWRASETDAVIISLSRHGVKVTDDRRQRVFLRIPMHALSSVFQYSEESKQNHVVLEVGNPEALHDFKYYIYEVPTEGDGQRMCSTFESAFETVFAKSTLESL